MIKTVIRISNGMVLVFDENGEQLPQYQGYYTDVRDQILADATNGAVFNHWFGHAERPRDVGPVAW